MLYALILYMSGGTYIFNIGSVRQSFEKLVHDRFYLISEFLTIATPILSKKNHFFQIKLILILAGT